MLEMLQGFHIEPTNICTLKCHKCARTDFISRFPNKWKNKQLDLDKFKKFIDIDIENKIFSLSGNYGDPIYYSKLFDLLIWLKSQGAKIIITTNGSYKTTDWWQELGEILDFNDQIFFAIDGIPENFTTYRINADWQSIELGIRIIAKHTRAIWKYIPFKFNENNIEQAKKLAHELGMESLVVHPSSRWDSINDPFKPDLISPLYQQKISWKPKVDFALDPKCKNSNLEHFISADGYYMPCCYVGDHRFYYSSEFYKHKEKFNISTVTISQILEQLNDFYDGIEETKHNYCTFNCAKI